MIVHIYTKGDPSVGIWGISTSVDLQMEPTDNEDRDAIRTILAEAFTEIYGEPASVQYQDELEAERKQEDELAARVAQEEKEFDRRFDS